MVENGIKRKAETSPRIDHKRTKRTDAEGQKIEERFGIVDRQYYPPQMSTARCVQYTQNRLEKPIDFLARTQRETATKREQIPTGSSVVHWFKGDLRLKDNKALHLASAFATQHKVPLIALYIISPQDFQAHVRSAVRVDFILRTLHIMQQDLAALDIPLVVETIEARNKVPERVLDLCAEWKSNHLFANVEYEVDELRREAKITTLGADRNIAVDVVPDSCVVSPGELASGSGSQYSVYSPWFRAWVAYLHRHPHHLNLYPSPDRNPSDARSRLQKLFGSIIPQAPTSHRLTDDERTRFDAMWPAGEHAADERLAKFLEEKVRRYKDTRNLPAANSTAVISVHLAAGTLSARTAVTRARDVNSGAKLDSGNANITGWISELAWRDFYKHVLAHWPYVCMNKPFKPEYTDIEWEYDETLFGKWCNGQTGYPFVDAAMRQLLHMGYMHNRARMVVASFLAKDLLIDWRMGERYFMSKLIDGDFASNNGGWGFSASTGVDPQPYFRIFNPILQSEKFDPDGEYIRRWVPELNQIQGKAIHDPYGRKAPISACRGYPRMCVDHRESRNRALSRYKAGLQRDTA